jgi:hypothetical protein
MKCLIATTVFVLLIPVAALSQEFTGSHTYVAMGGENTVQNLPNGRFLSRGISSEFVVADDPASPLHLATSECFAVSIGSQINPDNPGWLAGDVRFSGYCLFVDKDGDVMWTFFQGKSDGSSSGGTDRCMGGTGKFEGVEGGGVFEDTVDYPGANKWIGRWEGTIKLK